MHFCMALRCQFVRSLDDQVVDSSDLSLWMRRIDGRHNHAWKWATDFADQMHRHRTFTQQMPIQRRDENAFERRLMLHILDHQIRLRCCHVLKDLLQRVACEKHLGTQVDPASTDQIGFIVEPFFVLLLASLTKPRTGVDQTQDVEIFDKHRDVQRCARGLGNGDGPLQCRRVTHGGAGY